MKFGIVVNEGPFTHQASDSAYLFAKAALEKGHQVLRVFFYYDGVNNGNKLSSPQADDRNLVKLWGELAAEYKLDLVVCVAAALRRGIKDEILAAGFRISGLGQLIEAGVMRFSAALAPLKRQVNIRVNCICPGWVDTPMVQRTRAERSPEEWQAIAPAVMLQPEEIADAVVQFVRDEALAGRVMLYYEGEPRQLVPVETEM